MRSKMTDPVCGMTVDPARAAGTSDYKAVTYAFCSAGCKHKFDAEPDRYSQQANSCCSPAAPSSPDREAGTKKGELLRRCAPGGHQHGYRSSVRYEDRSRESSGVYLRRNDVLLLRQGMHRKVRGRA